MKTSITSKALVIITIVAIIGFGTYAFAGWGMGYGHHGRGHYGPGYHHEGWGGSGYGHMMDDLSDVDIEKLDKARSDYLKATENLRQDLYDKELELRNELAKQDPDAKKAAKLQMDISKLEEKLDQKHLDHMIQVRKINPDAGRGYRSGMDRGFGGGYCWR